MAVSRSGDPAVGADIAAATKPFGRNFAIILKQIRALIACGLARMERDMNTVIAKYLAGSSEKTVTSFDGLVSVAMFSGIGLLVSVLVLILDRYVPGDWF